LDPVTTELPIACSLSAAEMPARLAEMAEIGGASLLAADTSGRHARLRFGEDVREPLSEIIAAEAACCPFLTMRLSDAPGAVTLTIDGPEGAEPIIEQLVRAFAA
jgi:hypothetical protein